MGRVGMAWPSVRTSPAAAIVIAAILLQGCALSPVTPPGVEVENVQLTGLGALDQTVAVTLCATNPNASQLVFRNVRFRIAINGTPFAEGNSLSAIRLPPGSSTLVPLTVDTTIGNLGPQLLVTLATGRVAYAVDGSVGLNGLPFSVPFQRSGSLSVLRTGLGLLQATDTPMATMCGLPIARPRPASNGAAETPG